ncbi:hypothetical protein [Brochothrix campestris]|uniref:Uncharacterized protein n=1 Tax=Brochothrix campestris FSL F6-1037 TaxID=1265861 RepID=W7CU59_9LIST|nr:hypothetical protein [Brochothrix campestris]EUJ39331.1 hypothetical protein BCAMP_07300 [Brochothrix campestris FSL F6-1037]
MTDWHHQFCNDLAGIPDKRTIELSTEETVEDVLMAYDEALAAGHRERAIALCRAAITQQIGEQSTWQFKLCLLYLDSQQPELAVIEFRALFQLDTLVFSDEYFALLERLGYEKEREAAFNQLSKSYWVQQANELFANNQKWHHLSINISRDLTEITTYAEVLLAHDPEAVYRLYTAYLMHAAKECENRRQYRRLCQQLRHLASLDCDGKQTAAVVVANLRETYPKKRALLEELDDVWE